MIEVCCSVQKVHQKEVCPIIETTNYSLFKKLEGNRPVSSGRVKKIRKSIEKVGYILSPICVNEKFEIIDGQGRYEALKELKMPVHYYIAPGTGRDQCIAMNIHGTKWTTRDHIDSYADAGNQDYVRIRKLIDKYKHLGQCSVLSVITGNNFGTEQLIRGGACCSELEFNRAAKMLEKINAFYPIIQKADGRIDHFVKALSFALIVCKADVDKLKTRLDGYGDIRGVSSTSQVLKTMTAAYNHRTKVGRMYFDTEYDKYLHSDAKSMWDYTI